MNKNVIVGIIIVVVVAVAAFYYFYGSAPTDTTGEAVPAESMSDDQVMEDLSAEGEESLGAEAEHQEVDELLDQVAQ